MKKALGPFLIKLFFPGILALPWILDIPLEFIPSPDYYDRDLPFPGEYAKPIAFCLFVFAIISPLIFFNQKPRSFKIILTISWILALGVFAANQWIPFDPYINDRLSFLASACGGTVLAGTYLFLAIRAERYRLQRFRFHSLAVLVVLCIGIVMLVLGEFEDEISQISGKNSLELFSVFEIIGAILFFSFMASVLLHYIASIRHFKNRVHDADDLIDEIGSS